MKKLTSPLPSTTQSPMRRTIERLGQASVDKASKAAGAAAPQALKQADVGEPPAGLSGSPSAAVQAAQKALLGGAPERPGAPRTVASAQAQHGVEAQTQGAASGFSWKTAIRAAVVGLAFFASGLGVTDGHAQTVFLDHNDAPLEIAVAKKLAQSKGEAFVLVRPNLESVEAAFQKAHTGEQGMRHLILSGHSSGMRVWGQGADGTHHETSFEQFRALKEKYPKAFDNVDHISFMSCYSGSAGNSAQWSALFPNAQIVGFWGSGLSKTQPAAHKMLHNSEMSMRRLDAQIERRTLSPQQALIAARQMAAQDGSKVTKFAVRLPTNDGASVHFALGQQATPIDQARDRVEVLQARVFDNFMAAQGAEFQQPPTNHSASPLRDYYNALHTYLNALPADDYQAGQTRDKIEVTIRLIYFDVVTQKMQQAHAGTFAEANRLLSQAMVPLQIPSDISRLTRHEAVKLADSLQALGQLQHVGFEAKHSADLGTVNRWLLSQRQSAVEIPTLSTSSHQAGWAADALTASVAEAPANVKAAAERLATAMKAPMPEALQQTIRLFGEGLKDLKPEVIPSGWIG